MYINTPFNYTGSDAGYNCYWNNDDDLIKDGYNYEILELNYNKVARNKTEKNSKEIIIKNY